MKIISIKSLLLEMGDGCSLQCETATFNKAEIDKKAEDIHNQQFYKEDNETSVI